MLDPCKSIAGNIDQWHLYIWVGVSHFLLACPLQSSRMAFPCSLCQGVDQKHLWLTSSSLGGNSLAGSRSRSSQGPPRQCFLTVGECRALLGRSTTLPPWPQVEMFLFHQALHWIPLSPPASVYWLSPTPLLGRLSFCSCLARVSPLPTPPFFSAGLRKSPLQTLHPLCLLHARLA